jgi:hypothetical protein
MSICLNVYTEDKDLEELLNHLSTHGNHDSAESKVALLEKAATWLRATYHTSYDCKSSEVLIALSVAETKKSVFDLYAKDGEPHLKITRSSSR